MVEYAQYFRCTLEKEYVNKLFYTGVTSWICTELLFMYTVDFSGITIYLYGLVIWNKDMNFCTWSKYRWLKTSTQFLWLWISILISITVRFRSPRHGSKPILLGTVQCCNKKAIPVPAVWDKWRKTKAEVKDILMARCRIFSVFQQSNHPNGCVPLFVRLVSLFLVSKKKGKKKRILRCMYTLFN